MIKQLHFWVYTQRSQKQSLKELFVHPHSQQHHSQ